MAEISQCLKLAFESVFKGKNLVECISGNFVSESCDLKVERIYQNQQMLNVWEVSGMAIWIFIQPWI